MQARAIRLRDSCAREAPLPRFVAQLAPASLRLQASLSADCTSPLEFPFLPARRVASDSRDPIHCKRCHPLLAFRLPRDA